MKSKKQLNSFIKYCENHKEERFWQALTNWSKYNFILGSKAIDFEDIPNNMEDVFYLEDAK